MHPLCTAHNAFALASKIALRCVALESDATFCYKLGLNIHRGGHQYRQTHIKIIPVMLINDTILWFTMLQCQSITEN